MLLISTLISVNAFDHTLYYAHINKHVFIYEFCFDLLRLRFTVTCKCCTVGKQLNLLTTAINRLIIIISFPRCHASFLNLEIHSHFGPHLCTFLVALVFQIGSDQFVQTVKYNFSHLN